MDKWFLELTVGYSILFLGFGCKDEIIHLFSKYLMNQCGMMVCTFNDQDNKGAIAFVDFLDRILILVFRLPAVERKRRKNVMYRCQRIIELLISSKKRICIVINNLNGKTIRRYQDELILLANCPNIYFIATVDSDINPCIDFITHNISTGLEYVFPPNTSDVEWIHRAMPVIDTPHTDHADVLILEKLLRDNLGVDDYCYKVFVTYGLFKWMGINAICDCKTPKEIYIRLRYLYLVEGIDAPLILTIPGVLDFVLFCAELMNGDGVKYVLLNGFNCHKKDYLFKKVGFCEPQTQLMIIGKAIEYGVWNSTYEPITGLSVAKLILYSINECQFTGQPIDKTNVIRDRFNLTHQSAVMQAFTRTNDDDEYGILTSVMKDNLEHAKVIFMYLKNEMKPNMMNLFHYHAIMYGTEKEGECVMLNSIFKHVGLFKENKNGRLKRSRYFDDNKDGRLKRSRYFDDDEEKNNGDAITFLLSI